MYGSLRGIYSIFDRKQVQQLLQIWIPKNVILLQPMSLPKVEGRTSSHILVLTLKRFPDCAAFAKYVLEAFESEEISARVVQWAVC